MDPSKTLDPQWVLSSIYNGVITINSDGIVTFFNKTAERIFNIPYHEALDRHILEILPNTGGKLLECVKTGQSFYGEKLKGEHVAFVSNISPVMNQGRITGAVSVFQEISEIENITQELDLFKNMKNWLDTIIDSSYDGLWICDHEGKVIRINKASERINGLKAEEVVGKNMRELVAKELFDKSVTVEVLKKRTSVTMIQQVRGGKRILVTGNPIFNENGEITFVVTNDRDITELDHLRNQLHETQALAREYSSKLSELEMKGVDLSNIIFRSAEMQRIIELTLRVAPTDSTVLLLGESGVGKGMIAKLIHKQSVRRSGPFIRVDCGGIPDSLVESELFGYEKGAFTGARVEGKPGFFELADKGTLFLDEIGELPLSSQSKLLRFLEDREIVRVGGAHPRRVDVRIIAATNKNLEETVALKTFREDLYYRLNVVPIYISSLRERREDILPLIFHFLKRFTETYQNKRTFSPEAIDVLCKYDFPGNIRELTNLIERLVVVSEQDRIDVTDLPNTVRRVTSKTIPHPLPADEISLKKALENYEGLIIERAIRKYGSQREAARVLKIDQATLSRKMRKFSLAKNDAIMHK
jgi:PAS domain S-box-containing protein